MIQRIKNSKIGSRVIGCAIACVVLVVLAGHALAYTSWKLLGYSFSSFGIYQSNVLELNVEHLYSAMNDAGDTTVLYNAITYGSYTNYLTWYKNNYTASVLIGDYSVYLGSQLTSATLSERSDTPNVNMTYLLCYPSSEEVSVAVDTFPTVAYTIKIDGATVNTGSIEYGICVVSYPDDGAVTFTFINPDTSVAFSGKYGSEVTVSTAVDGETWFDEDNYVLSEYSASYPLTGTSLSAIQTSVEDGSSVNQGDVINLSGSWSGNTMIFYTTDGSDPDITWDDSKVVWLTNTGWDGISTGWVAGDNTYLYDDTTGIAVTASATDTTDTGFEINAVVVYANRGTAAEGSDDYLHADATFTYNLFDQQFGTPMANRANNENIAKIDSVMLSLDENTLEVLNSFPCYADGSFFLVEYGTQTDDITSVQNSDPLADTSASSTVTRKGDSPIEGVQYTTYLSYLNTGTVVWPTIKYTPETSADASSITNEDVQTNGTSYQYGTRTITRTVRADGGYDYTITYQNPDSIILTGNEDETIQLHTVITAMDTTVGGYFVKVKLSDLATFKYTVIGQLSTPTATPATSASSMSSVDAGDNIVLVATTSNASIYYTTDGTYPSVTWDADENTWVPDSDATKLYTTGSIIVPSPADWQSASYVSTFTVNAITVSNDNSLYQSDVASYPYYVNALPAADAPTASPTTSSDAVTALANGTNIYLSTSVSGGQIYYTTDGTYPDAIAWFIAYNTNYASSGNDATAAAYAYAQTGISRYSSSDPIVMQAESGSDFTVKAVTIDASTVPSYSISAVATFSYALASATAPTALPTTSTTSTTTVDIGDNIILLSADSNTSIYYTTNGTTPSVTWSETEGEWVAANTDTLLYTGAITVPGPDNGIGAVVSTTFTINAITVNTASDTVLQSDVASFTYLVNPLPAAAAPTVSPTTSADSVTALANGTSIYLSCSISGGQIYYTTNNTYPDAAAWIAAYNAAYDAESGDATAAAVAAYEATGVTLYSSASPIVMAADASGSFTIQAVTVDASTVPSYSISDVASYTFALSSTSAPTAIPSTSADSITTVDVGNEILLLCADSTASIFYTTNGATPSVIWSDEADAWVAANTSTLQYTGAIKVPGAADGAFSTSTTIYTINAIAISASDSVLQSEMASFTYLVNPLPAASAPTASPTTSTDVLTTIANGTEIYLSCSISGGQIYYTTDNTYPDAAAWITAYNAACAKGEDATTAAATATAETGVTRYSSTSPIIMAAGANGTFTIKAVTVDESTTPSYSVSDVATYTYSIASVSTPTAIPSTSADAITSVEVGDSILLVTTDANTRIFYTTDGSVPVVSWDDSIGWVTASDATVYYSGAIAVEGAENGHLVATSSTLTINAIAISAVDSVLQSGMATFTYVINPLPAAAAPTVSPTTSTDSVTQLANGTSIYLSCGVSGGQIYYTTDNTYPDVVAWLAAYSAAYDLGASATEAAKAAYNVTGVSLYSSSSPVTMAADASGSFTIQAVTVDGSSVPSYSVSDVAIYTFAITTASTPTANPTTSTDSVTTVDVGDSIVLLSADSSTSIYYTTNGATPSVTWDTTTSAWVPDADTTLYTGAITVSGAENGSFSATSSTLTINAIAISASDSVLQSSMATFTYLVNPLPAAAAPTVSPTTSADSVTPLADGTEIYLSCSISGGQIYYTTNNTYPDAAAWITAYNAACENGQDATAAAETATANTGVSLYSSTSPITMAADASGSFTIRAVTVDGSSVPSYSVSDVAIYTFGIASVSAPTVIPTTSADSITTVDVGDSIVLLSSDTNTRIFYTTDGTVPVVQQGVLGWESGNDSTSYYNGAITVPSADYGNLVAATSILTINAIAVSESDSVQQSEMASYTYLVNPLPAADAPTASPASSTEGTTAVANGSEIYLSSSTSGGQIYYTTNGAYPDVTAWYNAYLEEYLTSFDADLAEESAYQATGVQMFSVNEPIVMQANSGGTFTVKAVTVDESTTPSYSISDVATFTYTLASAASPTTSVATSADSVTIVSPGSPIKLMVTTANTTIYFTTDNSIPVASDDAPDYDPDANQTGTVKYNSSTGIVMPSDVSSLFTIRAIAHSDITVDDAGNLQYADSAEAVFYYQLPADVSLVTASPIGATTTSQDPVSVVQGTTVSLTSLTEGATIYYEVFTSITALESAMESYSLTTANSQLYSEINQITIKEDCWIRAVATKDGMYSSETIFGYSIADTLDAPTASLASGAVVQKGSVIVLSASGDVVYTTDGTDPSAADSTATYGNSIVLNADEGTSMVIRAYSTADGYTPSEVISFTYTICAADDYLQASPTSGSTIQSGSSITLVTTLTGADIYYTTDGTTPTVTNGLDLYESGSGSYTSYEWSAGTSTTKGNSLTVTGSPGEVIIVKAIAIANGSTGTTTSVFTYTFAEQTPAPTASIPSGAITLSGATVTLTASEGSIYYTTDGTDPTSSSALYTSPIDITDSVVLKIRAYSDGKEASEIVTYVYTRAGQVAAPTTDVPSGAIALGTLVSLSTTTEGATIYYSTDGTEPTVDNMESLMFYDQPFVVSRSVTIKMIAATTGMDPSVVNTVTYTVIDPVVEEEEEVVEPSNITSTDRLVSRRDYSTQEDGPSYDDVVLQDNATLLIVSAEEGVLAQDTELVVVEVYASDAEIASAEALGYQIVSVYEVALYANGEAVVPTDIFEIGVPIADSAYNASISVASFTSASNATMQTLETRRSGGFGYVMVDGVARYAVIAPLVSETFSVSLSAADVVNNLPLIAFVGAMVFVGGIGAVTVAKRRALKATVIEEQPDPEELYPTLDSFFHP